MTSFKSRVFNFMIRNGHLFRGQRKKEVFDLNTSIPAFRERCEKGAAKFGRLPAGVLLSIRW
jgi:epsilon-lactone hydrolase